LAILAFPLDVDLDVGGPLFVDLDEDGAEKARAALPGQPWCLKLDAINAQR
jgi:hypothetical protein